MSGLTALKDLLEPVDSFDARPVVRALVEQAAEAGASDLHLRPTSECVEVLFRCDGVLQHRYDLDLSIYPRLLVGLKNLARLASYKHSVPQDGRLTVDNLELRVAVAPSLHGEKVVLRLVLPGHGLLEPEELGYTATELEQLLRLIDQPQGLILATGPAGSGKTTTLLTLMRRLSQRYRARLGPMPGAALNIVTLEDPVEVVVPEFTQTPILPASGMTFASALRSLLRQDPELILVGEIRDAETAGAVIQTSLTGHLVFSTLHTRDSLGVVPRLLELGVAPYQLAASLAGVVYQRLVRRLCSSCRVEVDPGPELEQERRRHSLPNESAYAPRGCSDCAQTGYRGRAVIGEIAEITEPLRQGILDRAPLQKLRELAVEEGLVHLREAALQRVGQGLTSYDEICRVIPRSPR